MLKLADRGFKTATITALVNIKENMLTMNKRIGNHGKENRNY